EARAEEFGTDIDTLKAKFANIMEKAADEGGFSDPKSFLKGLTADEREIIQITQGLADPISKQGIDGLSDEGALNLLLPNGAQRDWNGDALYTVGRGHGFRFPTDSTPPHVKAAWEETVTGMGEKGLMLAEGKMMINLMSANSKQDAAGNFVGFYEPGDKEFRDPFSDFDFARNAKMNLAFNEHVRGQISADQYQRDKTFWSKFGRALDGETSA
ncbi:MAG: hypothetical protein JKY57_04525, partial [Kordiimonadaceae bacterium]|nr:hypothetical protein [Kordiimonadaceae bacterium]